MKFLIEAHHPADVHFWKFAIQELTERGHEHLFLSRDRDVMRRLLERYPFINAKTVSTAGGGNRFPMVEFLQRQWGVFRHVLSYRPDVVASCMGSYTQTAGMLGRPNLVFTDSEFQNFNHKIAHPFATAIYTPECFTKPLGRKQRKYRGFHELAGLSPRHFKRDAAVAARLDPDGRGYALLRVSAWNTLHDVGLEGIGKRLGEVVSRLEKSMTVWISPEEGKLDAEFARNKLDLHPADYDQALAHARIVVTEGASTASEAAVLGTPTLYVNPTTRGYLDYLEERYGLVRQIRNPVETASAIDALLEESCNGSGRQRAPALFEDHEDMVSYIVNALESSGR